MYFIWNPNKEEKSLLVEVRNSNLLSVRGQESPPSPPQKNHACLCVLGTVLSGGKAEVWEGRGSVRAAMQTGKVRMHEARTLTSPWSKAGAAIHCLKGGDFVF